MPYYQSCTILCVVYIKLVFGCWGAYPENQTFFINFTEDGDRYGGYGAYFAPGAIYNLYGDGKSINFGPDGPNSTINAADENALLPSGIPSQDSLKNIFKDKWETWMKNYYIKKALEDNQSGILTSAERKEQADPFWPASLLGFGKGYTGENPPPYAYVPNNDEGFPSLCFHPIHNGRYTGIRCDPGPRYAFVAGINICVSFYYRGCGGNQNNFKDKKSCEDLCTKIPEAGCKPNTQQNLGHIIIDY